MSTGRFEQYSVADLSFDRDNPRLAEYGIGPSTPENEVLSVLWDAMDVRELVQSIAASGFFQHEPLIVAQEKGKNVVVEGNRRLAAVKVLTDPGLAKSLKADVPEIAKKMRHELETLPVEISGREDAWRFLGFKHVNGPVKWSSYAKAKYIANVHRDYDVTLSGISSQIGDGHRTVQRLYRGLMVIEQAERHGVYDREDRFNPRFAFSHLYTGLDYEGIGAFLNVEPLDSESSEPVSKDKLAELGELCTWLYGSKKSGRPPVVQTQNPHLRQLDSVLRNLESLAALRDQETLSAAFEITREAGVVFEEALLRAKRELQRASGHIAAGYDGGDQLLRVAGTIADMADLIYREMEKKKTGIRPQRLTEE